MSDRKTVYVHIGFDRTGTTSFQRYCVRHAKNLYRQGVHYPTNVSIFENINHAPLTASYLPTGIPDDYHLRRSRSDHDAVVSALKTEIDKAPAAAVLISSEHLSTRFMAPQIQAFARDLNDYHCKIVVVVREHLARFLSSYATHIMSGSEKTLDDYATMALAGDNPYVRYAETIRLWETAFGRENLIVLDYRENHDMVGKLLGRLDLTTPGANLAKYNYNGSLDMVGTEALRLINVALHADRKVGAPQDYFEFRRSEYIRSHLHKQMRQARSSKPAWRLQNNHVASLAAIGAVDRVFLSDAYQLDLEPMTIATGASDDIHGETAEVLAITLMKTICRQPLHRAAIASRSVAFSVIENMRRIRAR